MRILLAEDERDLCRIIAQKLTADGHSVDCCHTGTDAMDYLDAADYDAAILDIMMPGADGYAVLSHIRRQGSSLPVLFLTARDGVEDRVKGLDSGADDYLTKPFSFAELAARLRAMTRKQFGMTHSQIQVADLTLDTATHRVTRGNREIVLSAREYQLLEYLMRNRGVVLSREKIEDHIYNFDYTGGTNVVDVYISYLRKKIDTPGLPRLIHTVRGSGYVLREPAL